jgi:hypothetical protein
MSWVNIAVAAVTVIGTAVSASSQKKAAKAEKAAAAKRQDAANVEAAHMDQQAGLSIASAQRTMLEERKNARLLESRAQAVAAASGAGASDTTVVNVISRIAAEGAYRSSVALYDGVERARQLNIGADIRRAGGDLQAEYGRSAAKAMEIAAVGTIFQGASSIAARYATRTKTDTTSGGLSDGASVESDTD